MNGELTFFNIWNHLRYIIMLTQKNYKAKAQKAKKDWTEESQHHKPKYYVSVTYARIFTPS